MQRIEHLYKDLTKPTKRLKKIKRSIKRISPKSAHLEREAKLEWFKLNPPKNGMWNCYLQISFLCPKKVDMEFLVQEHVKPKGRYPELKYDPTNRKAACTFCNALKGGQSVETIVKEYPSSKIARDYKNKG